MVLKKFSTGLIVVFSKNKYLLSKQIIHIHVRSKHNDENNNSEKIKKIIWLSPYVKEQWVVLFKSIASKKKWQPCIFSHVCQDRLYIMYSNWEGRRSGDFSQYILLVGIGAWNNSHYMLKTKYKVKF